MPARFEASSPGGLRPPPVSRTRAELLRDLGRRAEARLADEHGLALTANAAERNLLEQRPQLTTADGEYTHTSKVPASGDSWPVWTSLVVPAETSRSDAQCHRKSLRPALR